MIELVHTVQGFWWQIPSETWAKLVPAVFGVAAILWFFLVYLRGKFRFLPAWAIARVTVLDSIGRLEVVFLLLIGVLLVAVHGYNLYSPATRNLLLNSQIIQSQIGAAMGSLAIELSPMEKEVFLCDMLGRAAMLTSEFFVAIIGFVLAMFVLPNEINRGVILSILPKPLTRGEYIFGKFLGIWIIVTGCFLVLAAELYLIEHIWYSMHQGPHYELFRFGKHFPTNWPLITAMCLFPFKYATLVLVIMGLTLRLPEVPASIIGLGIFIAGHFTDRLYGMIYDVTPFFGWVLRTSFWMLPHLTEAFSVNILDVDAIFLENWGALWGWVWQIVVYNCVLLWLLSWLFHRRSL